MATDLAEVHGGAIALNILFDLPLLLGGVITAAVATGLLIARPSRPASLRTGHPHHARRHRGRVHRRSVRRAPPPGAVVGGLVPAFDGTGSVLLAAGMLGATVMPHAVYLHSALARDRHGRPSDRELPKLLRATRIDVGAAMLLAGAVNLAMLLALFAIGLLASLLASTSVGCYAGAVVMAGLLRRSVPLLLRRVITMIPR